MTSQLLFGLMEINPGGNMGNVIETMTYQLLLILMDINLPDIDGYSLTTHLRKNLKLEGTPIVALTANVMKGDRERSLESGCDGYIQKPIDVDNLPQQIEVFLRGNQCQIPG